MWIVTNYSYCPENVSIWDIHIDNNEINHCLMNTFTSAIIAGYILIFGIIQLSLYLKNGNKVAKNQLKKFAFLYYAEIIITIFMVFFEAVRITLSALVFKNYIYGYIVTHSSLSVFAYSFSLALIKVQRNFLLPFKLVKKLAIVLATFWALIFLAENFALIKFSSSKDFISGEYKTEILLYSLRSCLSFGLFLLNLQKLLRVNASAKVELVDCKKVDTDDGASPKTEREEKPKAVRVDNNAATFARSSVYQSFNNQTLIPEIFVAPRDKQAIYQHPFFPLLALLHKKCDLALQSVNDTPSSYQVNLHIQTFVGNLKKHPKPYAADPEVDSLIIQYIQVLRFHLLELAKIHEESANFCNRFISRLKEENPFESIENNADTALQLNDLSHPESSAAATSATTSGVGAAEGAATMIQQKIAFQPINPEQQEQILSILKANPPLMAYDIRQRHRETHVRQIQTGESQVYHTDLTLRQVQNYFKDAGKNTFIRPNIVKKSKGDTSSEDENDSSNEDK